MKKKIISTLAIGTVVLGLVSGCTKEQNEEQGKKAEEKRYEQMYGVPMEGKPEEQMRIGDYVTYDGKGYLENDIGQYYYSEPEIYLVNKGLALLYGQPPKLEGIAKANYTKQLEAFQQQHPEIPKKLASEIISESYFFPIYVENYLKKRYTKEIASEAYKQYEQDSRYVSYLMYRANAHDPKKIKSRLQAIKTEKEAVEAINYTREFMYYVSLDNLNAPNRENAEINLDGVKKGEIVKRSYKGEGYYIKIVDTPKKVGDYYKLKDYFKETFTNEFKGEQALYQFIADLDKRTDAMEINLEVYEYLAQRGIERAKKAKTETNPNQRPLNILDNPQYFMERSMNP